MSSTTTGVGGKFRKNPVRISKTTPYDRPPSIRAPNPTSYGGGWFSKLITSGAHKLFHSVFRKRLTAPIPDDCLESRNEVQEYIHMDPLQEKEAAIVEGSNLRNISDGSNIATLEQIFKKKTFTRSEIDRLTELLHSRTLEFPVEGTEKRPNANYSNLVAIQNQQEILMQENESHRLLGPTTPVVSSRIFEDDIAAPAELAKVYMGSRPSKVSPLKLGFRSQAFKDDSNLSSNPAALRPKSTIKLPAPITTIHRGVRDNNFVTPRSRGRSAIYNMARTPYPRALPAASNMSARSTVDGFRGPSSSQCRLNQNGFSDARQSILKRRSSDLDDEDGSVGPIRRLRHKSNLLAAKNLNIPISGIISLPDVPQQSLTLTQKPLLMDDPKDVNNNNIGSVPSQSRESAAKILQHLDTLVSPLKEEAKLAAARKTPPAKLSTNMLQGRALRSLENVDTSKLLQTVKDNKSDSSCTTLVPDFNHFSSPKQDKVKPKSPVKLVVPSESASLTHAVETTVPIGDSVSVKSSNPVIANIVSTSSQIKRAFQMSVHEDYLDLDDDSNINEVATVSDQKLDTSVKGKNFRHATTILDEKISVSFEAKPLTDSVLTESTDLRTSDAFTEKNASFTFQVASVPSTDVHSTLPVSPSFSKHSPIPPKEQNIAVPVFSFGLGKVNGVPSVGFSSSSSASESLGMTISNPKPENMNGFTTVATEVVENSKTEKADSEKQQGVGGLFSKSAATPSFVTPDEKNLPVSSGFTFGNAVKKSNLNNGSLSSKAPDDGSNGVTEPSFSNTSPSVASSSSVSSSSATLLPSSLSPVFQLGSSPATADPKTTQEKNLETQNTFSFGGAGAEPTKEKSFGIQTTAFNFGGMESKPSQEKSSGTPDATFSFGSTDAKSAQDKTLGTLNATSIFKATEAKPTHDKTLGTQNSIFNFGGADVKSTQEKTLGIQTSGFNFGGTSNVSSDRGSVFGFGTSSIPSTVNTATLFGSSPLCSSSQPFGSSTPVTNMFSSSTSSSSITVANPFGSNSPPFGSSTPASTGGFSFGLSSASSASNSAPMTFGLSAPTSAFTLPSNSGFAFGASPNGGNDQMNMEDSMAEEDEMQTPPGPVFGQTPSPVFGQIPAVPGFGFNSTAPSGPPSFQFGQANPSSFQGSSSFNAGGSSFSLGSGGGMDKSNRKIIRVKSKTRKK